MIIRLVVFHIKSMNKYKTSTIDISIEQGRVLVVSIGYE